MNVPVNNIRNGIYPPDSGKYITNFRSDGAAMRIAPIGEVVGSVCGPLHGLSAFLKDWVEKVRFSNGTCLELTKGKDILDIFDQLTELIRSEQ